MINRNHETASVVKLTPVAVPALVGGLGVGIARRGEEDEDEDEKTKTEHRKQGK